MGKRERIGLTLCLKRLSLLFFPASLLLSEESGCSPTWAFPGMKEESALFLAALLLHWDLGFYFLNSAKAVTALPFTFPFAKFCWILLSPLWLLLSFSGIFMGFCWGEGREYNECGRFLRLTFEGMVTALYWPTGTSHAMIPSQFYFPAQPKPHIQLCPRHIPLCGPHRLLKFSVLQAGLITAPSNPALLNLSFFLYPSVVNTPTLHPVVRE